jgi:fructose-1,6-bisphosphatase/inositol monophosphatase family enzyme
MSQTPVLLDDLLRLARDLAGRAGDLLLEGLERPRLEVETKTTGTDMVTEMDKASERLIVEGILAARPQDGILGEEGTEIAGTSGVRWVVDPLDGTTNYLYHHPPFAVSIAAEVDGEVAVGVVNDPVHREEFTAVRGRGSARNGVTLRPAPAPPLRTALVATGFAYEPDTRVHQAGVLAGVLPRVRDVRRLGAAAIDLCSVACARVDAYYELGLQPWDLAAGALVATEAGYVVGGLDGRSTPPPRHLVLVAPSDLFEPFRALLVDSGARAAIEMGGADS